MTVYVAEINGRAVAAFNAQNEIQATCPTDLPVGEVFDCSIIACHREDPR